MARPVARNSALWHRSRDMALACLLLAFFTVVADLLAQRTVAELPLQSTLSLALGRPRILGLAVARAVSPQPPGAAAAV